MAIPEDQLDTWSHQGSIQQSSATYQGIKGALEVPGSAYSGKNYVVFLQGSYGNDTNIYSESDVDIVIRLDDTFAHDLTELSQTDLQAFESFYGDASYRHENFKKDIIGVLGKKYGADVKEGEKAIEIRASGNRRKADVIVAIEFRRYYKFQASYSAQFDTGICFFDLNGNRIVNYPKQHSDNCTRKHQETNSWFKPTVRILKNMRRRMVDEGLIESKVAPSYYLEGLLYNVPLQEFGGSYQDTFVNSYNWIMQADRSKFVCANEQYYLLRDGSPVTWRDEKCAQFLKAVGEFWNQW